jgi:hypothetical protein
LLQALNRSLFSMFDFSNKTKTPPHMKSKTSMLMIMVIFRWNVYSQTNMIALMYTTRRLVFFDLLFRTGRLFANDGIHEPIGDGEDELDMEDQQPA